MQKHWRNKRETRSPPKQMHAMHAVIYFWEVLATSFEEAVVLKEILLFVLHSVLFLFSQLVRSHCA